MSAQLTPERLFMALNAYQQSMALKGAIDLELFTYIAQGASTAPEIARRCHASERGAAILCDFLTIHGFLTKDRDSYGLTPESAMFLSKDSPAYLGTAANFLVSERGLKQYRDVAALVRKGGALDDGEGLSPEHPMWVEFARNMVPIVFPAAQAMARIVSEPGKKSKVLDIAAGHGMFGISVAQQNPAAEIFAVDWKNVLEVAIENAIRAGVRDRYRTIPGSAFEVDFGSDYDLVLLPNFLHHFDAATNTKLLKKIRAALKPGGKVATLEFVPNDDRVTPPAAAAFSFIMLGATAAGQAYTFRELDQMLRDAGFGASTIQDVPGSPERLILTDY
jgi:SAM-dependent methyltransferase